MKSAMTLGAIMVSMGGMFVGFIALLDTNIDRIYDEVRLSDKRYEMQIRELEIALVVINERCECTKEALWRSQSAGTLQREK